jgi:hypothetical protein
MLTQFLVHPSDLVVEGLDHRETGPEARRPALNPLQPAGKILQDRQRAVEYCIDPAHPDKGMVAFGDDPSLRDFALGGDRAVKAATVRCDQWRSP